MFWMEWSALWKADSSLLLVDDVTALQKAKKVIVKQPKKRGMSPEVRKRIGDAQRKRWAATKKQASASAAKTTKKLKSATPSKNAAPKRGARKASPVKAAPAAAKPEAPKAKTPA